MGYKICVRCIMDITDPGITFDSNGTCNHCKTAESVLNGYPFNLDVATKKAELDRIIAQIKKTGTGAKYDCLIGLSGGVDSSYVAYKVHEMGLRPLAVHLDNGWDSEPAVQNIENICGKLDIDLITVVLD
jgi:hypothetical protein